MLKGRHNIPILIFVVYKSILPQRHNIMQSGHTLYKQLRAKRTMYSADETFKPGIMKLNSAVGMWTDRHSATVQSSSSLCMGVGSHFHSFCKLQILLHANYRPHLVCTCSTLSQKVCNHTIISGTKHYFSKRLW